MKTIKNVKQARARPSVELAWSQILCLKNEPHPLYILSPLSFFLCYLILYTELGPESLFIDITVFKNTSLRFLDVRSTRTGGGQLRRSHRRGTGAGTGTSEDTRGQTDICLLYWLPRAPI